MPSTGNSRRRNERGQAELHGCTGAARSRLATAFEAPRAAAAATWEGHQQAASGRNAEAVLLADVPVDGAAGTHCNSVHAAHAMRCAALRRSRHPPEAQSPRGKPRDKSYNYFRVFAKPASSAIL